MKNKFILFSPWLLKSPVTTSARISAKRAQPTLHQDTLKTVQFGGYRLGFRV